MRVMGANRKPWYFRSWERLRHAKPYEVIAAVAAALIVFDTFVKPLTITSLGLTLLALSPWLLRFVKTMELPGGVKVEIRELEEAAKEAEEAGLLAPTETVRSQPKYRELFDVDPTLALAGLRIDIERRLNRLLELSNLQLSRSGLREKTAVLANTGAITLEQAHAIDDLVPLLNSAAHAVHFDPASASWTMDVGPRLLAGLDEIIDREVKARAASGA